MIKKIFVVIFLLAGPFLSADPLRDAVENSDRTAKMLLEMYTETLMKPYLFSR